MKSQERDRFEAAVANPSIVTLTDEKTGRYDHAYTLTLGPGQVRYLDAFDFFGANIESLLETLHTATGMVEISSVPTRLAHLIGEYDHGDFETEKLDSLLTIAKWEERLRIHHALGRLWMQEGVAPVVYVLFHRRLELGHHFAIAECLEAWVRGSATDRAFADSYRSSPEHLLVSGGWGEFTVFIRTAFVRERLQIIGAAESRRFEAQTAKAERLRTDEDARRASAEAERLRRSQFTTFVYIMEDTRKKAFKIGRSKTPGKRERTLQSEVPETTLRFSIPAEEKHEKELHERFAKRRIRGEWFELTEEDLLEALAFLKANGDAGRVEADRHWVGSLFLGSR